MPTTAPPMQERIYRSHGLTVVSCVPLPFCEAALRDTSLADVSIVHDSDTDTSPKSLGSDERLTYGGDISFTIQDGRKITLQAPRASDPALLGTLITTGPWKALLHQRGLFPFRGSAVRHGDDAWAIVGRRSAGASTLALSLMNAGARLISDGTFTIERTAQGHTCIPNGQIRLEAWEDTMASCGEGRTCARLRPDLPRYGLTETSPPGTSARLKRLLLIAPGHGPTTAVRPLSRTKSFERVLSLMDRHLIRHPSLRPRLLQDATSMIASASALDVVLGKDLMTRENRAVVMRLIQSINEA